MGAWMLGSLPLCLPGDRFGTTLSCILVAFGHLWCHLGWSLHCSKPVVAAGLHLSSQGVQMSYLALLCAGGSVNWRAQGEGRGLKLGRPVARDCAGLWPLYKNS